MARSASARHGSTAMAVSGASASPGSECWLAVPVIDPPCIAAEFANLTTSLIPRLALVVEGAARHPSPAVLIAGRYAKHAKIGCVLTDHSIETLNPSFTMRAVAIWPRLG